MPKLEKRRINLSDLHQGQARINLSQEYLAKASEIAGVGREVILTGAAPVWMYLKIAHSLHGKVTTLKYDSPSTGEILIFDHNPW